MLTEDAVLSQLARSARPVEPDAALEPAGEDCLRDSQLRALIAGEPAGEATVACLARHVPECSRCWSLVALFLGERPLGDETQAAVAIDRAIARRLASLPVSERLRIRDRLVAFVLPWLPGPAGARPALAGAFADDVEEAGAELTITEGDLPLVVRLTSPDGTPAGLEVAFLGADGAEVFRARTDDTGSVVFAGPSGRYLCRVVGYDGPLLREAGS